MTLSPAFVEALQVVQPLLWSVVAAGVVTLLTMWIADDITL